MTGVPADGRGFVGPPVRPPVPRFRMYVRPYPANRWNGSMAYYWLVRVDADGSRVVDRGEGFAAKRRIERFLRVLRAGSSPDWVLAARAMYTGWEVRR